MRKQMAVAIAIASLAAFCVMVSRTKVRTKTWQVPPGTVYLFRFSPTDKHAAVVLQEPHSPAAVHRLIVVAPDSRTVLLDENGYFATNLCFDLSGRHIAVRWADGVRIYALRDGACIQSIEISQRTALFDCMAFTDDGSVFAMANKESPSDFVAWAVSTAEPVGMLGKVSHWAGQSIAGDFSKWFSHCGWVTPGPSIVNVNLGRRITHCVRFPPHIYAAFTRDSSNLLTVHKDGAILLWELRDTVHDEEYLLPSQNAAILNSHIEDGIQDAIAFAILHKTDRLAIVAADRTFQFAHLPLIPADRQITK